MNVIDFHVTKILSSDILTMLRNNICFVSEDHA